MLCQWAGCNYSNESLYSLFEHAKKHLNAKPYACLWRGCHRLCYKKAELRAHLLTHIPYRAFRCSKCEKGFKREQELRRHFVSIHFSRKEETHQVSKIDIFNLIN